MMASGFPLPLRLKRNCPPPLNTYNDTTFGTDDHVSREQMAVILYRYAQSKKYDVSVGENTKLLGYSDAGSVSEYAAPAMQWACRDS